MMVKKGKGEHELGVRDVINDGFRRSETEPKLDRAIQSRIGDQLRAMYNDLLDQPVPDRFRDLLAQLEERKKEENSR